MKKLFWINTYLNLWRVVPAYLFLRTNNHRTKCAKDLQVWIDYAVYLKSYSEFLAFGYLFVNFKEFRNILLNRLHRNPLMWVITRILFPPLESCYINMPPEKIGGGFSLQHGFSTIIAAQEIGENCRIYQQVTVGFKGKEAPVIGDNVTITAGAIIIGDVRIGNGACIGAGSVVTHDVANDAVVAGVPARDIKCNQ
jgi:serine O-acetyltransferase